MLVLKRQVALARAHEARQTRPQWPVVAYRGSPGQLPLLGWLRQLRKRQQGQGTTTTRTPLDRVAQRAVVPGPRSTAQDRDKTAT